MPSAAYIQGMQQNLERKDAIRKLQMEETLEKQRLQEMKRKTDKARQQAVLMGIPKEEADAMSVGELEGWIRQKTDEHKEQVKEEGRQIGERDNKAMAAAAMEWAQLNPAVQGYFVRQAGVQPNMAQQVWESLGMGARARALGVRHGKTLEKADDYDRTMAQEVAQATGMIQKDEATFRREAPVREVDLEAKRASAAQAKAQAGEAEARTRETTVRTNKAREEETMRATDLARNGGAPEFRRMPDGSWMYRNPGKTEWEQKRLTADEALAMIAGGGAAGAAGSGESGGNVQRSTSNVQQATEVRRKTKDGRVAVFDSKTKQFLRYDDGTEIQYHLEKIGD